MNPMLALYHNGAEHQVRAMEAFSLGLHAHGIDHHIVYKDSLSIDSEVGVFWGTRNQKMISQHNQYIILELGYFDDRLENISAGWNGLNNRADFRNGGSSPDRWLTYGRTLEYWDLNPIGEHIVIMGQVEGDMSVSNVDLKGWYGDMVKEIRNHTDLPILFRAHPQARSSYAPAGCTPYIGTLYDVLREACAVVTYNSNVGVDAVIDGRAVYAHDRGSMVYDLAAHTIKDVLDFNYPSREQWSYNLAYCQWTFEEIANGDTWEHLCRQH